MQLLALVEKVVDIYTEALAFEATGVKRPEDGVGRVGPSGRPIIYCAWSSSSRFVINCSRKTSMVAIRAANERASSLSI